MINISQSTYTPGAWAGGTTHAIWAEPASAIGSPAGALCWAGLALIERDAPYSFFAGRRRLHMPIRGRGLRLSFAEPAEDVTLASGEQHTFSGERPLRAALLDGPVVAFNLIYRADALAAATLAAVGPEPRAWPVHTPPHGSGARRAVRMAFASAGALTISGAGGPPLSLASGDALLIPPDSPAGTAQIGIAAAGPAPAEVILATMWLPAGDAG